MNRINRDSQFRFPAPWQYTSDGGLPPLHPDFMFGFDVRPEPEPWRKITWKQRLENYADFTFSPLAVPGAASGWATRPDGSLPVLRSLADVEDLAGFDAIQRIEGAGGPVDFNAVGGSRLAQAEVQAQVVL